MLWGGMMTGMTMKSNNSKGINTRVGMCTGSCR